MEIEKMFNKVFKQYKILKNLVVGEKAPNSYYNTIEEIDLDTVCFCNNERTVTEHSLYCSKCGVGTSLRYNLFGDEQFFIKDHDKKSDLYPSDNTSKACIFVSANEDSLVFERVVMSLKVKGSDVKENVVIKNRAIITPGKPSRAYKIVRKKEEEIPFSDVFDWFGINTKTLKNKYKPDLFFDNADNLIDFLRKNETIIQKTAFWEVFANTDAVFGKDIFFLFYMYIYGSYPVVELLAKMGFYKLLSDIFSKMLLCWNKDKIRETIAKLKDLFNETTKGSAALKMPFFVANYLKGLNASLDAFEFFSDLYELEPFSKECFDFLIQKNFVSNMGFSFTRSCWECNSAKENFLNILKYKGLSIKKIVSHYYLSDFCKSKKIPSIIEPNLFKDYLSHLADLLKMCEFLEIDYLPLPTNIKEVHDKTAERFNEYKEKKYEDLLNTIAEKNKIFIPDNEDYQIIIPSSSKDFINEGIQQHNCVASYANRVANGECLIFFIREKSKPNKSFVTAEYRNGRIAQILLKNNNPLSIKHKDILTFAEKFAKNISCKIVPKSSIGCSTS